MRSLRRKLRAFAATWLVFQAAWLTALVPRDCCAGHRPAEKSCHEIVEATACPMRDVTGRACPMHSGGEHHAQTPSTSSDDCQLSSVCDGPMAALFALLSNHAVLPDAADALPDPDARDVAPPIRESVTGRFEPPDAPPPRA